MNNKDYALPLNVDQYSQVFKVINPSREPDFNGGNVQDYLAYKTLEFKAEYYSPKQTTGR